MTWRRLSVITALVGVGLLLTMARMGEDRHAPLPTQSVLFCDGKALWVLSPSGKGRTRLVGGEPLASTLFPPRVFVSPGGGKALLICPDEPRLYLLEGAGRITPLGIAEVGSAPKAAWSPDEVWVAVSMGGSGGQGYEGTRVWAINTLTDQRYCVAQRAPPAGPGLYARDEPLGWPSATELAFLRRTGSLGSAEVPETKSLRVTPVPPPVNGGPRTVAESTAACHVAALLPDGHAAALWLGSQILAFDVRTGQRTVLTSQADDLGTARYDAGWGDNGDALFACNGGEEAAASAWRIAADGSQATRLQVTEGQVLPLAPIPVPLWRQLQNEVGTGDPYPLGSRIACSMMPPEYWVPPAVPDTVTLLAVTSEPPGAGVYVNGHYKGDTPCGITPASAQPWAQRYWVAVVHEDLEITCEELFLRKGQREEVHVGLNVPFTPASMPRDLAAVRSAVRKAILERDIEGLLRYVPEKGLVLDDDAQPQRVSRPALRQALRRNRAESAWQCLERNRKAFLQGGRIRPRQNGWLADEDAYSYCWVDFGRVGDRWCVTELGSGSVNE
ncbi:MAG: PEGA domain-containing protein [Armatimonadetes bacterium]|nr:PEGA domain-containing protein [Armatimonadota bacterium]